ncbi:MAG: nitrilase-related carbon-nitrogen hydrolase [Planctomycetota bacterium]
MVLNLAQPGVMRPEGFGHLAFFALGPWALAASRPGRRAFLAEWLAHAVGLLGWFLWMRHLLPWLLVPMALIPALYMAAGGALLRRLARRSPLALAAPVAWGAAELVRWHLPAPFSFGWLRTGELLHDTLWLSGSARVWGSHGLTYVLGALGGLAADLALARRSARPGPDRQGQGQGQGQSQSQGQGGGQGLSGATLALGAGPLALGVLLALFVPAPATSGSVGVVIAQPGIEQSLKGGRGDYVRDEFTPLVEEALAGIAEATAGGAPPPELLLCGETILSGWLVPQEVLAAYDAGVRPPAWSSRADLARLDLEVRDARARVLVAAFFGDARVLRPLRSMVAQVFGGLRAEWARDVLAGRRLLPEGTALLGGVEAWDVVEGELRRRNALALWDAAGDLAGIASKVQLVPAAESLEPVKHLPFVISAVQRVVGSVPDFVGAPTTQVLELRRAAGAPLRIGATICYDNAFDKPYTEPLRRGPVDLFVIASNEAWYLDSCEMDHLLALARMRALCTGRPVVRATNSGISAVIGGDGRDLAVLEVDGRRKMVRGHLAARVPLPADPAARTPFVATERWQLAGWFALALLLAFRARR